jgi:hypothetical protein
VTPRARCSAIVLFKVQSAVHRSRNTRINRRPRWSGCCFGSPPDRGVVAVTESRRAARCCRWVNEAACMTPSCLSSWCVSAAPSVVEELAAAESKGHSEAADESDARAERKPDKAEQATATMHTSLAGVSVCALPVPVRCASLVLLASAAAAARRPAEDRVGQQRAEHRDSREGEDRRQGSGTRGRYRTIRRSTCASLRCPVAVVGWGSGGLGQLRPRGDFPSTVATQHGSLSASTQQEEGHADRRRGGLATHRLCCADACCSGSLPESLHRASL